jgi:YggT family protein
VSIFRIVAYLIEAYIWLIMFPYAILSWFRILYRATEPVLRPVRRVIRPMGGLDFSFLIVILVAQFVLIPVLLH